MSSEFKYTKDMIEWRRNTVLQKLSLGYSQSEIARELKLHPSTISLDCQYLRLKANEDFHTYLQEELPREFQKAIVTYEYAIKTAARTAESTDDDKTRLQAVKEMREARTAKMDLISNHDVMSYQVNKQPVSGKMTQTNESEQSTDLEESEQESEGETEELQGEGQDADRE